MTDDGTAKDPDIRKRREPMSDYTFWKTGKASGKDPACRPAARGMFMVLEDNPEKGELSDDEYLQINLHAQKELCAQSPEFEKAMKHWSALPKNKDRQLGGLFTNVRRIEEDTAAEEWIHTFDDFDGLIYIYGITREIDFRTGRTWKPIPVVGFSLSGGIESLDDLGREHRMRYRLYYVFSEK